MFFLLSLQTIFSVFKLSSSVPLKNVETQPWTVVTASDTFLPGHESQVLNMWWECDYILKKCQYSTSSSTRTNVNESVICRKCYLSNWAESWNEKSVKSTRLWSFDTKKEAGPRQMAECFVLEGDKTTMLDNAVPVSVANSRTQQHDRRIQTNLSSCKWDE